MDVVRHEAVSEQLEAVFSFIVRQDFEVIFKVRFFKKNPLFLVTPIYHVVISIGEENPFSCLHLYHPLCYNRRRSTGFLTGY